MTALHTAAATALEMMPLKNTNFTNAVAAVLKGADADKVADALLAAARKERAASPLTPSGYIKTPSKPAAERSLSRKNAQKDAVANQVAKQMGTANAEGKAPTTVAREAKRAERSKKAPATSPKPDAKPAKPAATKGTFTSVDLAAEKGINAKTLRARIRRNIAKWEPLFAGEKHTFKDNATTRKAIDALLAAAK